MGGNLPRGRISERWLDVSCVRRSFGFARRIVELRASELPHRPTAKANKCNLFSMKGLTCEPMKTLASSVHISGNAVLSGFLFHQWRTPNRVGRHEI